MKKWLQGLSVKILNNLVTVGLLVMLSISPALAQAAEPVTARPAEALGTRYINGNLNIQSKYKRVASYTGPAGITVNSYSGKWASEAQLKEIYNELLANFHGQELAYLSTLNIYPDYPYGEGVAGLYHSKFSWESAVQRSYDKGRSIDLTGGDSYTTVGQMAKTLAHEYGHHFTMYYLWVKEGKSFENWRETRWAQVRKLTGLPDMGKPELHEWSPEEIAAEDYVQLFGSPLARKSTEFRSQYGSFSNSIYNLAPQENLSIPLAAEVPGLEEYWRGLAGAPTNNLNLAPYPPTLVLSAVEEAAVGIKHYTFRWTKSLDDQKSPLEYTLIYYEPGGALPYPVLTQQDGYQATYITDLREQTKLFRVLVKDSAGKISSSNIVKVDPNNSQIQELPEAVLFRDVPRSYWAFRQIQDFASGKYITGNPDNTFRPEQQVTRAEFIVLLVKVMGWEDEQQAGIVPADSNSPAGTGNAPQENNVPADSNSFADTKSHWAAGALELARAKGIITGDAYNNFNPEQKVSRAEMAAILARVLQSENLQPTAAVEPQNLRDLDSHWAKDAIITAAKAGLVSGEPDGSFHPDKIVKRAELVVVMDRLLTISSK